MSRRRKACPGPVVPIATVHALAASAVVERERATKWISVCVEGAESDHAATVYARGVVGALRDVDYAETLEMQWDPAVLVDVYAVSNEEQVWYVKLRVSEQKLIVSSCHPLERDQTLKNGRVLKVRP